MKAAFRFSAYWLLAVALVACGQKEEPFEPAPEPEEGDYSYTFTLAQEPAVKSVFTANHIAWEDGDDIGSYASTSVNKESPVSVNGSTGEVTMTIRSSVALTAGDMVYAYSPHLAVNNSVDDPSAVTLEIPRNQVSGSAAAMPMVALPFELTMPVEKYTNTNVGTLQFMYLGSVVKLNIFKSNGYSAGEVIENVTFQAGAACAGSFTYDLTAVDPDNMPAISGYTGEDVLVYGDGTNITVGENANNGGVFYLVVAPGTYAGTLVVRTSKGDYTYHFSSSREYRRGGLKPLNIDLSGASWTPFEGYDSSIDSPREFAAFLAGTSSSDTGSYTISADLDMTGYTLTSASGFGGTLNGNGHAIKNLTASVPLFATNAGTISNLNIDASCSFTPAPDCIQFGALVGVDDGGTYSSVSTAASITITATADIESNIALGGLVGASNNGSGSTFTSCANSGAITIDATGHTHWAVAMGGLVGWLKNTNGIFSVEK